VIWVEQNGEIVAIDARPSDALALALRSDCPVYASRAVLDNAKQVAEGPQNANGEEMRRWLENLNDDDMGRYKM
jgi:bifunctional DNase/RNase